MNKPLFIFLIHFLIYNNICFGQLDINLDKALENKGELLLNEIASGIDFVKLETTNNCLFNDPSEIKIINERIYFYDRKLSQFFIFGRDGKFIKSFGQQGKGPNEYVNIQNFAFDKIKNELIIFTRERKMLKYNLNGDLTGTCPVNASTFSLLPLNGQYIGYYPSPVCLENKKYILSLFDSNGILKNSYFTNIPCQERDAILFNRFYPFGDELRFWDCSIDTVYSIDYKFDVRPVYSFSSKRIMPHEMYSSFNSYQAGLHQYMTIQKIMESDRYLFIKGMAQTYGTGMYVVYDKSTGKSNLLQDDDFKKIGIKDNMISPLYFWPNEILADGTMVCCSQIPDLKEIFTNFDGKSKFLLQNKYQELKKIVENSKIDDNPILFLIKLKKID